METIIKAYSDKLANEYLTKSFQSSKINEFEELLSARNNEIFSLNNDLAGAIGNYDKLKLGCSDTNFDGNIYFLSKLRFGTKTNIMIFNQTFDICRRKFYT